MHILVATDADYVVNDVTAALGGPDVSFTIVREGRDVSRVVGERTPDLAILISCVGRKLVLKQRIEEEVEAVRDVLGAGAVLAGFYSHGEISPFTPGARCELHNQTMTITTLSEP